MAWSTLCFSSKRRKNQCLEQKRPAIGAKYRSSMWFILSSTMMANFTDMFIYSAIVPVAPFALPRRAGVAPNDVQYWISIMLAMFNVFAIATSLPCGWIGDRLGVRRPMFVIGTIVQFAGLALVTIGTSIPMWLAGRALQGTACTIVMTTTLPLILESAPKGQSARYLGLFTCSASAALMAGPLVGGVVYDRCGYYAVFTICFALNLMDFIARLLIIEKSNTPSTSTTAEVKDIEKNIIASTLTNKTPTTSAYDCDADTDTASETSSITVPTPPPHNKPIIISLLSSPRLLAALYAALLYTTIQTAFDATLSLFVSTTFTWSSIGGGLIFMPLLLSDFCGPVFGFLSDRFGARAISAAGLLLGVTPLICLRFVTQNTLPHQILLCALLAVTGLSMAAVLPAALSEVAAVIDEKTAERGEESVGAVSRGYALFNIAYSAGCLIGPLWGGLVRDAAGWGTMGWSLALLWASGLLPVLCFLR